LKCRREWLSTRQPRDHLQREKFQREKITRVKRGATKIQTISAHTDPLVGRYIGSDFLELEEEGLLNTHQDGPVVSEDPEDQVVPIIPTIGPIIRSS